MTEQRREERTGTGERGGDLIRPFRRRFIPKREQEKYRVDRAIRAASLLVIDENGQSLGVMDRDAALRLAEQKGLNLVEVAPNNMPPVAKIMDYGKFKYTQGKKEKETRRKQKASSMKVIKMRPKIGEHDLEIKIRKAMEFLHGQHKVRIIVEFRGREMAHVDLGKKLLDKVIEDLSPYGKPDKAPTMEGRNMSVNLMPLPENKQPPLPWEEEEEPQPEGEAAAE